MEVTAFTLTEMYVKLLMKLYINGTERESRVGKTKELIGVSLCIGNPRARLIVEPIRKHSLRYIVKECKWYFSGDYNITEIAKMAKLWYLVSDSHDMCNSNYGAKLFHHKVDRHHTQFDFVIRQLRFNPETRRAIFFLNLFDRDYKQMLDTRDFPCNIAAQLMKVNDRLDMFVFQRSGDLVYGLTNDIPFFTIVQEMIARLLGWELGHYHHYVTNLHIYEKHFDKLKGMHFKWKLDEREIPFPPMDIRDARALVDQDYNFVTPFMKAFNEAEK